MKLRVLILFVVGVNAFGQNNPGSQPPETLSDALRGATSPLTLSAGGDLGDAGGRLITDAIHEAQFVLVGETHFTRETPKFAAAVCRIMQPDRLAVEAGPYAAAYVDSHLQDPQRANHLKERERAFPDNVAMLNLEQENDFAADCAASSRKKKDFLWGLDQEFEGAAPVLLKLMEEQPNGSASAGAIRAALAKDRQDEAKARLTGDFNQLFLPHASDNDIAELESAIQKDGTSATQSILRELVESRRIYRLYLTGFWSDNNSERASLLKQNFLKNYRALQREKPTPRILLKFGDNHMWKGFNDTHDLNLGNFVAELASVEHSRSLHIRVLALRGKVGSLGGYAKPLHEEPFVLSEVPEYAWIKPLLETLPTNPAAEGAVVLDLRKLRFRNIPLPEEWQHVVYGYDLLVILPEFTPSTLSREGSG
jgi:hypothetical protein